MSKLKIVTLRESSVTNEVTKKVLLHALMQRDVKVVIVGRRKKEIGMIGHIGHQSTCLSSTIATMLRGTNVGQPIESKEWPLESSMRPKEIEPFIFTARPYADDCPTIWPEKKNFISQAPPLAKKLGNNRKKTKYRKK